MVVEAPGKVVVLGEYAVVDGAPAVVRAVDRGVRCTTTPSSTRTWQTPTDDDRFVAQALARVDAPPAHYAFSDWRPVEASEKVGLGGSAAATVAAVVAAWRLAGRSFTADEVFAVAFGVHHAVQGGGSGIDVAASAHGGWLRFESGRAQSVAAAPPSAIVYSGRSASTGPRVRQYLALPEAERQAFVEASRACVDRFAHAPVATMADAARLLREMADRAGIAYWTEGIERLVQLATDLGGAAKPSGAGGGDIVVAVFDDPTVRDDYETAAREQGFLPIAVQTAPGAGTADKS